MRTTVELDPDTYSAAEAYAGGKGITVSAALRELVRRSEHAPEMEAPPGRLKTDEYGYLVLARTGNVVTPERVKANSEDELV